MQRSHIILYGPNSKCKHKITYLLSSYLHCFEIPIARQRQQQRHCLRFLSCVIMPIPIQGILHETKGLYYLFGFASKKGNDYCFVILISGKHLTIYPFVGVLMLSQAPFALTDPATCDTHHTSINNYCFSSRVGGVYILGIFVAVLK